MSIISALSALWAHKPTEAQLTAVDQLFKKASALIELFEGHLPDGPDRQAAVNAVNQAVMHAHASLAHVAQKQAASDASDAQAASAAEAATPAAP